MNWKIIQNEISAVHRQQWQNLFNHSTSYEGRSILVLMIVENGFWILASI